MKKFLAFIAFALCGFSFLSAQTILTCTNSSTNARVEFLSKNGQTIKVKVYWDEGSGFNASSLNITNGTCTDCPMIGGMSREHGTEKVYTITQTNSTQEVTLAWASSGYCGGTSATVPGTGGMNCQNSSTGAKVTFLSKTGTTIKVKVDWDEGSTFSAASLDITNGTCTDCPRIGGMAREHGVQKTYTITQSNASQPVILKWGPYSNAYCGNDQLTIPAN